MALKKRKKVTAEFSMSSLTDIIFLLLIFFMLTSTMVKLDMYDLPESESKTVAPVNITVAIRKDNSWEFNGMKIKQSQITSKVRRALESQGPADKKNATITIVAEKGVPFRKVMKVMEVANKLKMRAIIATKAPDKKT